MLPEDPSDAEPTKLQRQPTGARPRLLVFWSDGSTDFELPATGSLTVGRSTKCDVRIEDESISRQHAIVHVTESEVAIEDLGSANGTRVGAMKLRKGLRVRVRPGDLVSMGNAMLLVQGLPALDEPRPTLTSSTLEGETRSPMERLNRLVELVAKSELSVLLRGETGVGKEVFAERIHRGSPRAHGPLVKLNCAALPDALLESELFGYERGAFTGAVQNKPGLLETAQGGTVFLDEIGEMPLATQAKLLRAIESREVLRVGALKPRAIDVRFIAATNRDIEELVVAGSFRQDLYFRLDGILLEIPPLRQRADEISELAVTFAREISQRNGRSAPTISRDAIAKLESHSWPGNIRELRNVIDRALVLCQEGTIGPEHVMLRSKGGAQGQGQAPASGSAIAVVKPTVTEAGPAPTEKDRILDALAKTGGNQSEAAKILGISRRTLLNRLDDYGIPRPRKREG